MNELLYDAVVNRGTVTSRLMFINLLDDDCFKEFDKDERTRSGLVATEGAELDVCAIACAVAVDNARDGGKGAELLGK